MAHLRTFQSTPMYCSTLDEKHFPSWFQVENLNCKLNCNQKILMFFCRTCAHWTCCEIASCTGTIYLGVWLEDGAPLLSSLLRWNVGSRNWNAQPDRSSSHFSTPGVIQPTPTLQALGLINIFHLQAWRDSFQTGKCNPVPVSQCAYSDPLLNFCFLTVNIKEWAISKVHHLLGFRAAVSAFLLAKSNC